MSRVQPEAKSRSSRSIMDPIRAEDFGFSQARRLLMRAGFGGTPAEVRQMVEWGPERSVDYLLEPDELLFASDHNAPVRGDVIVPLTKGERAARQAARRDQNEDALAKFRKRRQNQQQIDRKQIRALQRWWLSRMIQSPRPLEEKMTLFWHGHFATSYRTIQNAWHMHAQNRLFRSHALGNFGELLNQIIRDPAMIAYLDNNDSRKNAPNENLARELMELFSLGAGNYTERDIKEGARALTGYTFQGNSFEFRPKNHDDGPKTILGVQGMLDGDDFVHAILAQGACASFITRKLYSFFARELPDDLDLLDPDSQRVLSTLTGTFLESQYEVKPVLRRLFLSKHFYNYETSGGQIRSPVELVVQTIRSLGTPSRNAGVLVEAMGLMGQRLYFPPNVAGWAGGRAWINSSTLFVRQNTVVYLLTGKHPRNGKQNGPEFDPSVVLNMINPDDLSRTQNDARAVAQGLLRLCVGIAVEPAWSAIADVLGPNPTDPRAVKKALLLISALPEYQLC